jgi:hypothetical protein
MIGPHILLAAIAMLPMQDTKSFDPPSTGRPLNFSNIVGQYDIKVSATPTEVHVDEAIVLTVEISGTGPKAYEPARKSLRLFPASWEDDFFINDARDAVDLKARTWTFTYRLKPKHVKVKEIDGIELVFYDPSQNERNRFQSRFGAAIPLTVMATPEKDVVVEPLAASFYRQSTPGEIASAWTTYEAPPWALMLAIGLPPLLCFLGVVIYRRFTPGDVELRRRRRNEAAQRALADLHQGHDPAWTVVAMYLHERFDFPVIAATPAEVALFLKRCGFAKPVCEAGRTFFQDCDSVRYRRESSDDPGLGAAGANLIQALEADPCARS